MKRRLINFLFACILLVGVLPVLAEAERVTAESDTEYFIASSSWYAEMTFDVKTTVAIDYANTRENTYIGLWGKNGRITPKSGMYTWDNGGEYDHGWYGVWELEPGSYTIRILRNDQHVGDIRGAAWIKIYATYDAHTHNYSYSKTVHLYIAGI